MSCCSAVVVLQQERPPLLLLLLVYFLPHRDPLNGPVKAGSQGHITCGEVHLCKPDASYDPVTLGDGPRHPHARLPGHLQVIPELVDVEGGPTEPEELRYVDIHLTCLPIFLEAAIH